MITTQKAERNTQKFVGVWGACHSCLGEKGRKDLRGAEHQKNCVAHTKQKARSLGAHMFCNYQTY